MNVSDFGYTLPRALVAQYPLERRDASRLLVLERRAHCWEDRFFRDLPDILHGDEMMVVNNARVIAARLLGRRLGVHAEPCGRHSRSRGAFLKAPIEILLTRQLSEEVWEGLVRPGRKMRTGERVIFAEGELEAEVLGRGEYGVRRLRFRGSGNLLETIERIGHTPLPPYIDRPDEVADRERYQTIFARERGAVAAPTAGLHFTPEVVARLRGKGIEICELTLRVGLGTFQPIHAERVELHRMHSEAYEIPEAAASRINEARKTGQPILAVGTTVVRALEDAAWTCGDAPLEPGQFTADIFIYPGHKFRVVNQMLTNFHLPRSSLLVMASAFAGREFLLAAYQHAIAQRYRFYSYGDCMLIR